MSILISGDKAGCKEGVNAVMPASLSTESRAICIDLREAVEKPYLSEELTIS